MKRVILTGATGFVGANLARRLLADGHDLHLLLRPNYRPWRIESIRSQVSVHQVDLCDLPALQRVVSAIRPEWIFHLAVFGGYPAQTEAASMIQTNVVGTACLVEAGLAAGCEVLVNTGSSSEYGFSEHAPLESEALEPNSYYAVTKASATLFCRYTAQSRGIAIPTLRLYSVYGPYEEPTRLLPALILRGLAGELPPLVEPDVARDYVYVEDVVDAYLLAASLSHSEPGAVYNVGLGVQTSLREVVEVARRILPIAVEPQWGTLPNRSWDTRIWIADNRKIRERLGWQPRYSFETGFLAMVEWFRQNQRLYAAPNFSH